MRHIAHDVLILSSEDDRTVDFTTPALERAGLTWYRWDPGTVPTLSCAGSRFEHGRWCTGEISLGPGARLTLDAASVVWVRRPSSFFAPATVPTPEVRTFIDGECTWFFRGLWSTLTVPWVNDLDHGRIASYKPLQLARAAGLGFPVPRTYIGNDPDDVRSLARVCQWNVVVKPFHQAVVQSGAGEERELYTSTVSFDDLRNDDAIRACPSIWQEYVPKKVEIRATVVGEEVHAAEIHSQADERTRHDWRHYDANIEYRKHELPPEVVRACRSLVQEFRISFGAIDLVLTPEGEYVFLELNPFGQWAWIEQLCDLPIADAHARLFQSFKRTRRPVAA